MRRPHAPVHARSSPALLLLARRRALLALLSLAGCPVPGWPAPRELRLLTPADTEPQRLLLQALKARFPAMVAHADPAALDTRRPQDVAVALGPAALHRALGSGFKSPLVSILASSLTFRRLAGDSRPPTLTAIHAEASPLAQLQLIAALFERRVTVGVLLSELSAPLDKPLRQAAAATGLDLLVERCEPADVVRTLNRLGNAQVLLAVPDNTLYTPDTLRSVLESSYRRGLPVVGFSSATVAAGTLATAHAGIDDVVADLADLLDEMPPAGTPLPEPRFPRYWRVAINENVARSLGITITPRVLDLGNRPPRRQG